MKVERDGKYYLYSKDGTKKLGGPYDTEEEVWKRERQVQYFKRQGKTAMLKKAYFGPTVDLGFLGIPSMVGYQIGKSSGREVYQDGGAAPRYKATSVLGQFFVPGATGYHIGRGKGYRNARIEDERRKMEKKSALRLGDIEDNIGMHINDKWEPYTRRLISEQYEKRWPLRHPVLSLGVGHQISKGRAVDEVTRKLLRKSEGVRKHVRNLERQAYGRKIQEQKLEIERLKATQPQAVVREAVNGYLRGKYGPDTSTSSFVR